MFKKEIEIENDLLIHWKISLIWYEKILITLKIIERNSCNDSCQEYSRKIRWVSYS